MLSSYPNLTVVTNLIEDIKFLYLSVVTNYDKIETFLLCDGNLLEEIELRFKFMS